MTQDESTQVEDLLTAWYDWQRGYFPNLGAGRVDPSCRGFAEVDRYSDIEERTNNAVRKANKKLAEQIDLCVDQLAWQQRAAIQTHLKNKICGVTVWSNSRINPEEMHCLYQQAKSLLLPMLSKRGMIKAKTLA